MAGRLHIWCLFLGCTAAACSLIFCFVVVLVWEKGAWQTSKLWPLPTSWRNKIKHRSLIYSFALLHFLTFFFSKTHSYNIWFWFFKIYSTLAAEMGGWFLAGNQGNHQNFVSSLISKNLWRIFIEMKQNFFFLKKKSKMADVFQNHQFSKSFCENFRDWSLD